MQKSCDQVWKEVLDIIRSQINEQSYNTWFIPLKPKTMLDNTISVEIPGKFFSEWLDEHYKNLITSALEDVIDPGAAIKYVVKSTNGKNGRNGENGKSQKEEIIPSSAKTKYVRDNLSKFNLKYNFDSFVEGPSNQFAKAVALAVAEKPGKTKFNPLLIWGGVGLGKTHIAQAIGIHAIENKNLKTVSYVSSKQFTMDFISAIQSKKTKEFSSIYDKVDMLVVDDIEFFIGKESTQEQFFHTFNTMHLKGKQIVLTSDRPPREFSGLDIEERLTSRFQNGLVVDIKAPDLETRVAILKRKAGEEGINLDSEVALMMATHITKNIRELEGALIRLLAYSSMMGQSIDTNLARTVLKDLKVYETKPISIEDIQKMVAGHYDLNENLLRDKTRKQEIVLPRQIAMYLVKKLTNYSLKTTGLHFGGRDHTTVLHAINTVNLLMEQDERMRETISTLKQKIGYNQL
ncbi:MAG: chromosomal replication initiator protein DnaA [bacterium]|nr:chromosomal replication initiator protein DnaA [bacterium]